MSQKSMIMNIILKGDVDADFYKLGSELSTLGELFDQIGGKTREFEKSSLETYKNYETFMLEAKGALTAQYESRSELERVMRSLDEHAQGWAASTIFDTRDVAKAISEAAHAGWTYEEMISGIPQAMLLAQAGNLSLAEGLNYVIKALNATGTEFEDGGLLIDQWVMAANSGATNIGELGEAILRMGATARFGDSTAELFTMLAVLADIGTVGSDAGTLLRNSMIRLIAPTDKAATAMAGLGVTEAERLAMAADSAALEAANDLLEQTGFSAYDAEGNLKPFLETYKGLYEAVSGMSEVDKNAVLSAIFPTRTITGALGLLEAAGKGYDGLYEKILGSGGYAQTVADIQTSGLMGAHEELEGKWEEYSRKVGEILAPLETTGAQILGGFIDGLNNLDEVRLNALTGAMTAISVAGPAMTTIGGAIKLFTSIGPYATLFLASVTALGAAAGALTKISEMDLESTFGTLELDTEKLGKYVDGIETKFDIENSKVSQYATALATAQTNYMTLTQTLQEDLLSASLTGKTLTQEEIASITNLGTEIGFATLEGIRAARDGDLSFLDALFGDAEEGTDEAKALEDATDWTNSRYDELYAQAEQIGAQIRSSMVAALADGTLNAAEQEAIDASIARLNQIQAEIAQSMSRQEYLTGLKRAQNISWDSLEAYLETNAKNKEEELAQAEELYYAQYGQTMEAWERKYAKAGSDEERRALEADKENFEAQLLSELKESKEQIEAKFAEYSYAAFDSAMSKGKHGEAWEFLKRVWENEKPTVEDGIANLEGVNPYKYLNGVSAETMQKQLEELWDSEHGFFKTGSALSGIMKPFIQDSSIEAMLDSAIDMFDNDDEKWAKMTLGDGRAGAELTATVDGDTTMLEGSIAELDGTELTAYVGGDNTGLKDAINECDGMSITVKVNASGLSGLSGAKSGYSSPGALSTRSVMRYADGGRAEEASIFGEAGPEWAIPEEHSTRTADLLNLARQASGFTWGELISRYGGLNGSPGGTPLQLTYAPTIHAGDADGVERVLAGDKDRLMAMLRTMIEVERMRDDAEVYA